MNSLIFGLKYGSRVEFIGYGHGVSFLIWRILQFFVSRMTSHTRTVGLVRECF